MRGTREMIRMVPKMASSIVALRYAAMAAPIMAPVVVAVSRNMPILRFVIRSLT